MSRQAKLLVFLVLTGMGGVAIAQQNAMPCAVGIPVNVIVPDGRLIRELKADQFVVEPNMTG
jgi:hypothetical protein